MTLTEDDVTEIDGIRCTSLARTLLDIAEDGTRREVERALDHADQARILDMRAIDDVLTRANGRRGVKLLCAVLEEHRVGSTLTRNKLEEAYLRIARDAGLPPDAVNEWIAFPDGGGAEADFVYRAKRLIVETDGRDPHATRKAFKADRIRDQRLMLLGRRVVRFPWQQVIFEPGRGGGDAARAAGLRRSAAGPGLEPRHELAELQLLQPLADGLELGRAALDERAALAAELERLAQPRLAGVQPLDDVLQARGRRLVGQRLNQQRLGLRLGHRRP
jgi:hypothetical protein